MAQSVAIVGTTRTVYVRIRDVSLIEVYGANVTVQMTNGLVVTVEMPTHEEANGAVQDVLAAVQGIRAE